VGAKEKQVHSLSDSPNPQSLYSFLDHYPVDKRYTLLLRCFSETV